MNPQCSNCFFSRQSGTIYACHRNSPLPLTGGSGTESIAWPQVQDTDWCGEGYDDFNGNYYPHVRRA